MDTRLEHSFLRSSQVDFGETITQRSKVSGSMNQSLGMAPERRSTFSTVPSGFQSGGYGCFNSNSNQRMRNLSGGSIGSTASGSSMGSCSNLVDNQYSSNNISSSNCSLDLSPFVHSNQRSITSPSVNTGSSSASSSPSFFSSTSNLSHNHARNSATTSSFSIDNIGNGSNVNNSNSSSQQQQPQRSVNSSRYKTELCRPFEESGSCKYGDKCQFAHGAHELRNLSRHPKYKTELCRTFHTIGYCPYGPRCHFLHEQEPAPGAKVGGGDCVSPKLARSGSVHSSSGSCSPSLSPVGLGDGGYFNESSANTYTCQDNRQFKALTVNINANGDAQLERQFGLLNLNNENTNKGDIFSQVGVFSEKELDNHAVAASKKSGQRNSVQHLDNFPSFSDSEGPYWHPSLCAGNEDNFLSQLLSLGNHNSPIGSLSTGGISSSGSDSGSSDCSGSTENLIGGNPPFSNWRGMVSVGHY